MEALGREETLARLDFVVEMKGEVSGAAASDTTPELPGHAAAAR
jgi:hypothetical protein